MKRKLDVYLLYFSYVVELIYLFSARIFNNYESTHTIHVSESGKPIFGNMKIYLDISIFSYYLFFAIMILYILFVLLKLKNKEPINLLKSMEVLIVLEDVLYVWQVLEKKLCQRKNVVKLEW